LTIPGAFSRKKPCAYHKKGIPKTDKNHITGLLSSFVAFSKKSNIYTVKALVGRENNSSL
jgi:hypothetical protein